MDTCRLGSLDVRSKKALVVVVVVLPGFLPLFVANVHGSQAASGAPHRRCFRLISTLTLFRNNSEIAQ